jgi:hypothetical protein
VSARSCGPHSNRDDEIAAGSRQTTEGQLTWLDKGRSEAVGRVEGAAEAGKLGRNRGCHVRGRGLRFALDLLTNKGKKVSWQQRHWCWCSATSATFEAKRRQRRVQTPISWFINGISGSYYFPYFLVKPQYPV